MGKKDNKRIEDCVYCGREKGETRDHVIPTCLFTEQYPSNLITVPSCKRCNNNKSRDDDFIRDFLTINIFGNQSQDAREIFHKKVLKSVRRHSSELAKSAVKNFKFKPFYTKAGIYLIDAVTAPIDTQKIDRIISNIVRGLYYDACHQCIPESYSFRVQQYYPWDFARLWQKFEETNFTLKTRVLGNVFAGGFASSTEDPFTTIWLIAFYERVFFTVSTIPIGFTRDKK